MWCACLPPSSPWPYFHSDVPLLTQGSMHFSLTTFALTVWFPLPEMLFSKICAEFAASLSLGFYSPVPFSLKCSVQICYKCYEGENNHIIQEDPFFFLWKKIRRMIRNFIISQNSHSVDIYINRIYIYINLFQGRRAREESWVVSLDWNPGESHTEDPGLRFSSLLWWNEMEDRKRGWWRTL